MMVEKRVKITSTNVALKTKKKPAPTDPAWRKWKVEIVSEDQQPLSNIIDHIEYILHESFETPRMVRTREPYTLQEKGWGAFDLRIIFHFVDNLVAPQLMWFDLNFAQEAYSVSDTLTFESPPEEFLALLNIGSNGVNSGNTSIPQPVAKRKRQDSSDESSVASSEDAKRRSSSSSSVIDWDMAIASPPSAADSDGADDYQPKRVLAGKTTKKVPKNNKKPVKQVVEDDVYTAQDTVSLHTVHRMVDVSPETRKEWGVPEDVDMCELARALTLLDTNELQKCYSILQKRQSLEEHVKGDEFVFDLYAVGPDVISKLWILTTKHRRASS
ncbi:yeats family-domain-containing protein [Umbelopsis sp. AD052]|nr:yeats family-domain-containing protein [Umbelopsis sp. AD052]